MPAHRKYFSEEERVLAKRRIAKADRAANSEKIAARNRAWNLQSKYGLTLEQRDGLLAAQGGLCALPHCKKPIAFSGKGLKAAHIDHDHKTGKVRGILCGFCNTSLGRLGDSAESIKGVLDYINGTFGDLN